MMKPTILMILVLFSGAAAADDIYLTLGGWSKHSDGGFNEKKIGKKRLKYNGNHKALIAEYNGFTIGTFKNSYNERSNIAGYTYRKKYFYATAAVSSGYEEWMESCYGDKCLIGIIGIKYKIFSLGLMGRATALAVTLEL